MSPLGFLARTRSQASEQHQVAPLTAANYSSSGFPETESSAGIGIPEDDPPVDTIEAWPALTNTTKIAI